MVDQPQLAALDSSVLLSLCLNRPEHRDRVQAVQSVIDGGNYQIVIPSLVGVEVVGAIPMRLGKQTKPIRNSAIAQARAFLDRSDFMIAELDRRSMILAGELGPERLVRSHDAAIVATAVSAACNYVFTYDEEMIKKCNGWHGLEVSKPPPPTTLPINLPD